MTETVLVAEQDGSTRFNDVYERYESLARWAGSRTLFEHWVREHLQSLGMLGIISIEEKNEGMSGRSYYLYGLNPKLKLVVGALSETIDIVGIHESIRKYVKD